MTVESSTDGVSGSLDVPDTPGPPEFEVQNVPASSASLSAPPPSREASPEPRITNDREGSKKQKEAIKKLSTYSKEVADRKAERKAERETGSEAVEPTEPEVLGDDPKPEANPSESSMFTGNVIAALGVGVAALCLYLSYSPKPSEPESPPEDPPKPPPRPPRNTPLPRFKRL